MPRASWIRLMVHGLGAGALLSGLRVPLGLDWTQIPAVSATTAGLYRGAALLALALSLDPARKAFRGGLGSPWLLAVALGYALHGFAAPGWLEPTTRAGAVLFLVVLTIGLRSVAGRRTMPTGGPVPEVLGRSERLGLVLVGLGTALALETLAREVRLFTPGGRDAETVTGATFLLLAAAAAVSFGPLLQRLQPERVRASTGLALSGASVLVGLWFVAQLTPEGLYGYLKRFEALSGWMRGLDARLGDPLGLAEIPALDGTTIGTLWTTALLAAASFVLPAFVLGGTVGALGHAGRISYALLGAAAAFVIQPWWIGSLARPIAGAELAGTAWSWTLLAGAVVVSGLGLLVVSVPALTTRARILGCAASLLVVLLPWARPHLVQWSFSPWSAYSILPELVMPSPEGLVTVERAPDGSAIVTLDRRRLTPLVEERELDERRLALAWSLVPEDKRRGTVRALFVGQLTPERSRFLRGLGSIELERTAPWHAALPAIEAHLFQGGDSPVGELVSPAAAREKLADDGYDWIVVPPVLGPILLWKSRARALWGSAEMPALGHLDVGDETLGVAWVLADSAAGRLLPSESVLLAQSRFESLSIGVLRGGAGPTPVPLFPTGEPEREPTRLDVLRTLPHLRLCPLEAAFARRLGRAAEHDPVAPLARGLALHYGAQVFSSPYETRAQQIEIDEDALRAFAEQAAGREPPPDDFTRELWESLAQLFTEKRMPEETLVYLEPVALRFAPWPALDRAVGHAYREVLEPESALAAFERVLSVQGDDVVTLVECAACAEEIGDVPRARGYLERGLSIQPGNPALERALGLLLLRDGDASGRELLDRVLARDPEDEEVLRALHGTTPPVVDGAPAGAPPR